MKRPRIQDVARAAGVSPASVSRVISGSRRVTREVAEAVWEAAERLGYKPDYLGRALRQQSTDTVGMVVPGITNPFFPALIGEMEQELHALGQALILGDSQDRVDIERERVRALLDRHVDSLIVAPVSAESMDALQEAARRVPVVQIDRILSRLKIDSVAVDNATGIEMVITHLEQTGRRRLAFAGVAETMSTAQERLDAYVQAAGRLHPSNPDFVLLGDFSLDWGLRAGAEVLDHGAVPDAIVCANDLIAIGVVRTLTSAGVRVPDDIAVTGFDDIPLAAVIEPPLTTVRQPIREIARHVVRCLTRRADNSQASPERVMVQPELVVRSSTFGNQ